MKETWWRCQQEQTLLFKCECMGLVRITESEDTMATMETHTSRLIIKIKTYLKSHILIWAAMERELTVGKFHLFTIMLLDDEYWWKFITHYFNQSTLLSVLIHIKGFMLVNVKTNNNHHLLKLFEFLGLGGLLLLLWLCD